jgi:3-oxoacyl-[acyl-carrier-protein] synthase-3
MSFAQIVGTGSYLPERIVTNNDMAKLVETSDEWISTRTGIRERRISCGESTSELAYQAAKRALIAAKLKEEEVDLIICATITPDSFMPSTACIVQERLGAVNAAAFDLTAACSGLVYAIATATAYIESGMYENILVIGAETLSRALNWEDRSTCVLFGDGAGAVVVSSSSQRGILAVNLLSDGTKKDYLSLPAMPLKNPYRQDAEVSQSFITMKGQEVFKFAVRCINDQINTVLQRADITKEEIKYIVAHQANSRILEQAARLSKIAMDKFYMNLPLYGNTSAASIGIALDEMVGKGLLEPGDKLILVGFGAGMTSGAILLEWS